MVLGSSKDFFPKTGHLISHLWYIRSSCTKTFIIGWLVMNIGWNFQQTWKVKSAIQGFKAPLNRSDILLILDTQVIFSYSFIDLFIFPCIQSFTFSWRRPIPYRNQSTDLLYKSMDQFLYYRDLHHERVKENLKSNLKFKFQKFEWPGDLQVKIDKNYHQIKQGKIFALVIEIDM